jgi:short-subunit dehydrogenase
MYKVNERYALITGGTSGIGYELARLFAKDGFNLVIVARDQNELHITAEELQNVYGVKVVTIQKDLMLREAPFELYDEIVSMGITIDVLVNNAGQGQYGMFIDIDIKRELDIINLNICSYVVLTKCFLKDMVARNKGRILIVSSIGGELPTPLQAVYHASKAFITSFSEAVRRECKDTNVVITALLPGVTDTDFLRKADMEDVKMTREENRADPVEVAQDGYDALMEGKDKVISGMKNKAMVAGGNLMPDSVVTSYMEEQMQPDDKKDTW